MKSVMKLFIVSILTTNSPNFGTKMNSSIHLDAGFDWVALNLLICHKSIGIRKRIKEEGKGRGKIFKKRKEWKEEVCEERTKSSVFIQFICHQILFGGKEATI